MISPFLTQRTKSKFVFAGSSKSSDTLFKYIAPEQVPVQYGGLSREGNRNSPRLTLLQRLLSNQQQNMLLSSQFLRCGSQILGYISINYSSPTLVKDGKVSYKE
ncbi:Patellin-5, variant 2 [Lathyrus oleraceus]|nr:Patellin-5, variant 2 [Pisum sativum]